jgi:Glycerophosphoryl diester phosphodiesterase family
MAAAFLTALRLDAADPAPLLTRAHAHNDYEHKRPLLDALDQGFCSVEADVFLVNGSLWVAHSRSGLKPERQLTNLYLDPLLARVRARAGSVYETKAPFYLLIDIKENGAEVYGELQRLLPKYGEMLTRVRGRVVERGAITVVLSGDRPRPLVLADQDRYAALDGLLGDLDAGLPAGDVPWVSENWVDHFHWRGVGEMNPDDAAKLDSITRRAHEQGRQVRFWGAPDREAFWQRLDNAGVDWINTDRLSDCRAYFLKAHPVD